MNHAREQQRIDGIDLVNWFHSGAREVDAYRKYLNNINVFPVADGDTGTNLFTTMRAMVDQAARNRTFNEMARNLSESGLANARGNSGIIFASYVNGLAENGQQYESVDVREFSTIVHQAVGHLYHAIEKPLEGTMISVIRDWASFLFDHREAYQNFQELLGAAYHHATESLKKTTSQMEVLRKYNVVDSGAAGFVRFLHGINLFFSKGGQIEDEDLSLLDLDRQIPILEEFQGYRYCTNLLLEAQAIPDPLREQLSGLGDSLVISSAGGKTRLHIHTNEPGQVMGKLLTLGSVLEQKIDDMELENSIRQKRRHGVGLLTDSIADLPEAFKLEHQIHTLPLGILLDDTIFLDKLTIQPDSLFEKIPLAQTYPTSSQPEPGRVRAFLNKLLEEYDSLLFLSVSANLSGTWRTIRQEIQNMDTQGKQVTVIDTKVNSGAEGLLVMQAAALLDQGLSHEEVAAQIQARIPKTKIYVCLNTIEYAAKSGRVSNTVGTLGTKLGLRPIMTIDGEGKGATFGIGFSQKSLTKKILRLVRQTMKQGGISHYSIVHTQNPELAELYREKLTAIIGKEPDFICGISSVIAIHSGPGCVAVSLTEV